MRASGSVGSSQWTVASGGGAASMGTGGRSRMVGRVSAVCMAVARVGVVSSPCWAARSGLAARGGAVQGVRPVAGHGGAACSGVAGSSRFTGGGRSTGRDASSAASGTPASRC